MRDDPPCFVCGMLRACYCLPLFPSQRPMITEIRTHIHEHEEQKGVRRALCSDFLGPRHIEAPSHNSALATMYTTPVLQAFLLVLAAVNSACCTHTPCSYNSSVGLIRF